MSQLLIDTAFRLLRDGRTESFVLGYLLGSLTSAQSVTDTKIKTCKSDASFKSDFFDCTSNEPKKRKKITPQTDKPLKQKKKPHAPKADAQEHKNTDELQQITSAIENDENIKITNVINNESVKSRRSYPPLDQDAVKLFINNYLQLHSTDEISMNILIDEIEAAQLCGRTNAYKIITQMRSDGKLREYTTDLKGRGKKAIYLKAI